MGGLIFLFFTVFFASTVYSTVVLIQIGGWLPITVGLLLLCSYFVCGSVAMIGMGIAASQKKKKGELKDEGIRS